YATGFYLFTLSSRVYRKELVKLKLLWKSNQDTTELTAASIIRRINAQAKLVGSAIVNPFERKNT
ncbi:unnamed protein product, partial [Rotaria magnacalcarata]